MVDVAAKTMIGNLRKMSAQFTRPIEYTLVLGEHRIPLNVYLDQSLRLRFTGNIHCIQCGRQTKQSFQQGYCFPCMQRLAECHFCIIHPEKCHVEQGLCSPDDWAHAQCAQPHIVYLANSSGLKVGITRCTQMPTRWIDQGACQALPIFQVANRYQSGVIEVCLKQFVNDKTDWRKMLKQAAEPLNLPELWSTLFAKAEAPLRTAISAFPSGDITWLNDPTVTQVDYPVQYYPQKVVNLSFDKTPILGGKLHGIKGQYLFFDTGVINIRKFSGYEIEFITDEENSYDY